MLRIRAGIKLNASINPPVRKSSITIPEQGSGRWNWSNIERLTFTTSRCGKYAVDERPDLSKLSVALKDALIIALFEQVKELAATMQMLRVRVEELEGAIAQGQP